MKTCESKKQHISKCPTFVKMEMYYKEYMIKIKKYLNNP